MKTEMRMVNEVVKYCTLGWENFISRSGWNASNENPREFQMNLNVYYSVSQGSSDSLAKSPVSVAKNSCTTIGIPWFTRSLNPRVRSRLLYSIWKSVRSYVHSLRFRVYIILYILINIVYINGVYIMHHFHIK